MPATLLTEILLIITAAFFGGFAARTLRFPPVLGYIASGLLFGILGKNFLQSYDSLLHLSGIGVSLLLFTLGFEISLDSLKKFGKKILIVGVLQIVFVTLLLFPILTLFHFSIPIACMLAILFSFSSTAVVIKILEEKGRLNDFPGTHIFVFLLIQDVLVIPVFFLIPMLFTNTTITTDSAVSFLVASVKPILIFSAIFLFSKYLLSRFLNILYRYPSHELTMLATIFVAAVSIGLFQMAGLPQAIAAFLAGILISEQGKNLTPMSELRPFRDILLVLFFVLTGMLLNPLFLVSNILFIVLLTMCVLGLKFFAIYFTLRNSGYLSSPASFIASHLTNIGEFAIVIGQLALVQKFITNDVYYSLLSVFILSLVLTPLWTKNTARIGKILGSIQLFKKLFGENYDTFENISLEKYENHVVICGHGRVGKEVRHILDYAQVRYIVIDFNKHVISDLVGQNKKALYGDPTDEDILKSAYVQDARALVITVPDSRSQKKITKTALSLNPNLKILCRTHIEADKYALANLGVNSIVIPEFEAGVRIGREVLELFGVSEADLNMLTKRLRREHFLQ